MTLTEEEIKKLLESLDTTKKALEIWLKTVERMQEGIMYLVMSNNCLIEFFKGER